MILLEWLDCYTSYCVSTALFDVHVPMVAMHGFLNTESLA